MKLPLAIDYAPMEAELAKEIPRGEQWQYEPKWDGFRCLAFRADDQIDLISKSGQGLGRYFPEIVAALLALKAKYFVMDGELIITDQKRLDFDALLQRIHPAASRIKKLSQETPATLVLFDLLVDERARNLAGRALRTGGGCWSDLLNVLPLTILTCGFRPERWILPSRSNGSNGWRGRWMASSPRGPTCRTSPARGAMLKIKNLRTADCVVGGFRYGSKTKVVASLLLGLYDKEGLLHHVGFTSGLANVDKKALTAKLEALVKPPGFTGAAPGARADGARMDAVPTGIR